MVSLTEPAVTLPPHLKNIKSQNIHNIYTMTRIFLILIILRHCVLTITCKMTSLMSIIWIEHLCILQFAGMWHCHISTIRNNYQFHSSLNINLYFKSVTSIIEFYPLSEEIKELLTLGGLIQCEQHKPCRLGCRSMSRCWWTKGTSPWFVDHHRTRHSHACHWHA